MAPNYQIIPETAIFPILKFVLWLSFDISLIIQNGLLSSFALAFKYVSPKSQNATTFVDYRSVAGDIR